MKRWPRRHGSGELWPHFETSCGVRVTLSSANFRFSMLERFSREVKGA